MARVTPLGAVARGLVAGTIGTAAMTAWQELWAKLLSSADGGGEPHVDVRRQDRWERASAPAKVGRKILEGVFQRKVGPEKIGLLTNVMHWGYGMSWGTLYGLIQRTVPVRHCAADCCSAPGCGRCPT